MRFRLLIAVAMCMFVGLPTAAAVPAYDPSQLTHVGPAEQLIVVNAPHWHSTVGTLRAYERRNGTWVKVISSTRALLGSHGMKIASKRRQSTGTTPAGTFAIPTMFGRQPNPGTQMPYVQVDRNDAWTYNPKVPSTYNVFQTVNRGWWKYSYYVERLWEYGKQYNYVAVLDYNLPTGTITTGPDGVNRTDTPADTKAGGGIFLHVSNGTRTAGCIAIAESTMREITKWLDPAKHPRIVIGPTHSLDRM